MASRITIAIRTIHGGRPRPRGSPQTRLSEQADVGVGRGPGGPPHFAFKMSRGRLRYMLRGIAPSVSVG
jgi:hypothetical protein